MLFEKAAYLTDGGFETEMVFNEGFDLPEFASFPLIEAEDSRHVVMDYYRRFLEIAVQLKTGFVIETPTWRASEKWGKKLGYEEAALRDVNLEAVELAKELKAEYAGKIDEIIISGNIGPFDDGYAPNEMLTLEEAKEYHSAQASWFAETDVDVLTALTITYPAEAAGIVLAARENELPSVVSFTVETDGALPNGMKIEDAILEVDRLTEGGPLHYLINCAHPTHFNDSISNSVCRNRIAGVRANASTMSHEELDNAPELDSGDPEAFGFENRELLMNLTGLKIFGGCCGTDHRHVRSIAEKIFEAPVVR